MDRCSPAYPCPERNPTHVAIFGECWWVEHAGRKGTEDWCRCHHRRRDHIYNEGACRPGFVCPAACTSFIPAS